MKCETCGAEFDPAQRKQYHGKNGMRMCAECCRKAYNAYQRMIYQKRRPRPRRNHAVNLEAIKEKYKDGVTREILEEFARDLLQEDG